MSKCLKCQNNIPRRVKAEGKYKYISNTRKYCFECSPYNCHNTKILKDIDSVKKRICEKCGKPYIYERNKGHTLSFCSSCIQSNRKNRIKRNIVKKIGDKCSICGYDKCIDALCFHHLESEDKEMNIGNIWNRSVEFIMKEVKKCILVCSNCHIEIHYKIRNSKKT